MAKGDVNAVRQVLMNELGLTRESVREIMMNIVESTVKKHLTRIMKDGTLERMVGLELTKQYRSADGKWMTLDEQIRAAVRRASDVFVQDHVRIIAEPEKVREEKA